MIAFPLRRGAFARIVGFGLSMVLYAVATLWSIPALIVSGSLQQWGQIAVGQSIGVIAAVVGGYGWMLSGPASVARGSAQERRVEYLESLKLRTVLLPLVLLASAGACVVLVPADPYAAWIGSVTAGLLALRASWYFVGVGAPWQLLAAETTPRVAAIAVSVPLMQSRQITAIDGLLIQGLGIILSVVTCTVAILGSTRTAGEHADHVQQVRSIRQLLLAHRHGVLAQTISIVSGSAPLILVGALSPASAGVFALLYRLQFQVSTAASPLIDYFQGWVPRATQVERARRAWAAIAIVSVLSALGSVLLFMIGPFLFAWLSAGKTEVSTSALVLTTIAISAGLVSQASGRVAMPAIGRVRELSRNSFVSALIGTASVSILILLLRVDGALVGIIVGLLLLVALNLQELRRFGRQSRFGIDGRPQLPPLRA